MELAYIIGGLMLVAAVAAFAFELLKIGISMAVSMVTTLAVILTLAPTAIASERASRNTVNVNADTPHASVEKMREVMIRDMKATAVSMRQYPSATDTVRTIAEKLAG